MSKKSLGNNTAHQKSTPRLEDLLHNLFKERYVHNLSAKVYENIATLWHIDRDIEKQLSSICARVVLGDFCLKYLSHFHKALKKKLGIRKGIKAHDLSEKEIIQNLKNILSKEKEIGKTVKEDVLPILSELMEKVEIKDIDSLTKMAHTGEYLLASLKDMEENSHPEYHLWLQSIPHLYRNDLVYSKAITTSTKRAVVPLYEKVTNIERFLPPMPTKRTISVQLLKRYSTLRPPHKLRGVKKGFYPCRESAFTLTA